MCVNALACVYAYVRVCVCVNAHACVYVIAEGCVCVCFYVCASALRSPFRGEPRPPKGVAGLSQRVQVVEIGGGVGALVEEAGGPGLLDSLEPALVGGPSRLGPLPTRDGARWPGARGPRGYPSGRPGRPRSRPRPRTAVRAHRGPGADSLPAVKPKGWVFSSLPLSAHLYTQHAVVVAHV